MPAGKGDHRRRRSQRAVAGDAELRAISWLLDRRGFTLVEANPTDRLILPPDCSPEEEEELYQALKRYSSRILLRDLIQHPEGRRIEELGRFATAEVARELFERLTRIRVVEHIEGERWRLRRLPPEGPGDRPLHSFGQTLEWFVAQVFRRELHSPAAWGVVARGGQAGGDLDVVALIEGRFVLAEVKSAPPKHVELEGVRAFLHRVSALRPHAAFFVEDTELRMEDKIVKLFEQALSAHRPPIRVTRLEHEMFVVGRGVYIVSSRMDLATNLRACTAHYLRSEGLQGFGD